MGNRTWSVTFVVLASTLAPPSGLAGQSARHSNGSHTPPAASLRTPEPLVLARMSREPTLDGVVEPTEWANATSLTLTQFWPSFGAPLSQPSEVFLAYDDDYLYAAARLTDDEVRANSFQRDGWNGDDALDVIVDPLNDDRTAMLFTTTPLGMQQDQEILNDGVVAAGLEPINRAWNTFWDAASTITDEGWATEVRIPLSSLRYRLENGNATMGIIVGRTIIRTGALQVYPAIEPIHDRAYFKPSLAQDVILTGIPRRSPLYVSPYVLAGAGRQRERGLPAVETTTVEEIGGDVKYGLTDRLTLDLTVNTDFAQVESDAVQVNLDRFNLLFPERRQFFQERSSIFEFSHGDEGRLFHSRRIGLSDEGRQRRIFGGARLTGQIGAWDVGFLDMQIDGADGAPGENAGVVRMRRSMADGAARLGGIATSRVENDGHGRYAWGVDGLVRLGARDELTVQFAQTEDTERAEGLVDRSMAHVLVQRPTSDGFGYFVDGVYSGESYDPALGFEERNAFMSAKGQVRWGWRPAEGFWGRHMLRLTTRLFVRAEDRSLQSGLIRLRWTGSFRQGGLFNIAFNNEWEDLRAPLRLTPDVDVPAGRYFEQNVFMNVITGNARKVSGEALFFAEQFFDGWSARLRLTPTWAVSRHLSLSADVTRQRVWFPDRDQSFDPDIYRFRVRAARDTKLSGEVFVQYSRLAERATANFRVRYRFAEGQELFVVYDHLRDDREPAFLPDLGQTDQRLLIKYVHTLR